MGHRLSKSADFLAVQFSLWDEPDSVRNGDLSASVPRARPGEAQRDDKIPDNIESEAAVLS
jgi:hypothetical protein